MRIYAYKILKPILPKGLVKPILKPMSMSVPMPTVLLLFMLTFLASPGYICTIFSLINVALNHSYQHKSPAPQCIKDLDKLC